MRIANGEQRIVVANVTKLAMPRETCRDGSFEFLDNYKGTRTGKQRLFPTATVLAGKRVPAA
jgi:hypothetical protein